MEVSDLQPGQSNTDYVKSSWIKDYVFLIIGFSLVILSNYSNLNNTSEEDKLFKAGENISVEIPVVTQKLSNLRKEDIYN